MSKISNIYNALISNLESLNTGKDRMHNPYSLDNNPDICKKNSWGLRVLEANPEQLEWCHLTLSRSFTVVFMRHFITLTSKIDGFDAVSLALMEDQQATCNLLFSTDELGVPEDIDKIDITNVSGVQEMESDQKKYLFCEVSFNIILSENIT